MGKKTKPNLRTSKLKNDKTKQNKTNLQQTNKKVPQIKKNQTVQVVSQGENDVAPWMDTGVTRPLRHLHRCWGWGREGRLVLVTFSARSPWAGLGKKGLVGRLRTFTNYTRIQHSRVL